MKITHVINSLATGGAERLVVELANFGRQRGHDIQIVTLTQEEGIPADRAKFLKIPVHTLASSKKDPRIITRLQKRSADSDIVHVHLFPSLYYGSFLKGSKVYTEHSTFNRRQNNKYLRIPEALVYDRYSAAIAISEGVNAKLKSYFDQLKIKTPISLAQNGISEDFFNHDRIYSKKPYRIVSIGSLRPVKQHHLAIEAVAKLTDVTLEIAGDGPLMPVLQEKIRSLNLQDRVKLLGNVSNIPKLLLESDILLSTSEYEGFSLAAAEAQATGIPVVGPNVAGFREVVSDNLTGLLYHTPSTESIAETLREALKPEKYAELASNTRHHAQMFSLERCFDTHLSIYKDVLMATT